MNHDDILQCGRDMIAAGYIIYGSGTVFVLSVKERGYTVSHWIQVLVDFLGPIQISNSPINAHVYSVNEGYANQWDPRLRTYIESIKMVQQYGEHDILVLWSLIFTEIC